MIKSNPDLFGGYNGVTFKNDGQYRLALWRIWDDKLPKVMFIGLNPSTANESTDDPTIRRVKTFAKNWGFGGVYMLNLFTYVTAYPEELKTCRYPVLFADPFLLRYSKLASKIIFAWGSFKEAKNRGKEVIQMFPDGEVLGINKDGSPKHPLYISGKTKPFAYKELKFLILPYSTRHAIH